jgi:hypothetical protein
LVNANENITLSYVLNTKAFGFTSGDAFVTYNYSATSLPFQIENSSIPSKITSGVLVTGIALSTSGSKLFSFIPYYVGPIYGVDTLLKQQGQIHSSCEFLIPKTAALF